MTSSRVHVSFVARALFRSQVAEACKSGLLAYLRIFLDTIFFFFAEDYPKDIRGVYVGWEAPVHHSHTDGADSAG